MSSGASSRTPVPKSEAVSGFQIGIVIVGVSLTLPLLYSAGVLAQGMGLSKAIIAVVSAALILSVMSIPAAIVGVKTRLSSYMIVEHTFGFAGAKFVNFWLGIMLLGWYAVTAELLGRTFFIAAAELTTLAVPEYVYTISSSILVLVTTVYGFKAIDRLALIAVPFLLLAIAFVIGQSLKQATFATLLVIEGEGHGMSAAISEVVGAAIIGVILMPDLTRYARNTKDCVVASFLGQGGGMTIAYIGGMIPVLVWNVLDPMSYMFLVGFGVLALVVLVFATWTTNVINLYSAALSARASVPVGKYKSVVIVTGIIGTIAAVVGIADHLTDFLITLGLLVPPIAGVYLCDFFLLGRSKFAAEDLDTRPPFRVNAMIAGIGSGLLATWMFYAGASITTIGSLDSLLISVVVYLTLEKGGALLRRS